MSWEYLKYLTPENVRKGDLRQEHIDSNHLKNYKIQYRFADHKIGYRNEL